MLKQGDKVEYRTSKSGPWSPGRVYYIQSDGTIVVYVGSQGVSSVVYCHPDNVRAA